MLNWKIVVICYFSDEDLGAAWHPSTSVFFGHGCLEVSLHKTSMNASNTGQNTYHRVMLGFVYAFA